jgi:RNA polymerase II elongation factor ELL
MSPKISKKSDESNRERDRDRDYELERERGRERRERERKREKAREREMVLERRESAREMEREREEMEREKRRREEEMEQEEMERQRCQREKDRIAKERVSSVGFKRKNPTKDPEDTLDESSSKALLPKRRKLDGISPLTSSSSKFRDAGLPKKPVHEPSPVPRPKVKKEPSPIPPKHASISNQEPATTSLPSPSKSERSKTNSTMKVRRKSPIYTSSEEEREVPQTRKRNPSPPLVSERSNSDQSTRKESRHRSRASYPLPTDHAALRAQYRTQYSDYLGAFSKVVAQKRKIEAILNGDSDPEVDIMDPDDLTKLSMEHKTLKAELENIHHIYTKGTTSGGGGSTSD